MHIYQDDCSHLNGGKGVLLVSRPREHPLLLRWDSYVYDMQGLTESQVSRADQNCGLHPIADKLQWCGLQCSFIHRNIIKRYNSNTIKNWLDDPPWCGERTGHHPFTSLLGEETCNMQNKINSSSDAWGIIFAF